MSIIKSNIEGVPAVPFMADFEPAKSLWDGPCAPYPSEFSARWALRKLREKLVKEQALAMHRGRLMIHRRRFAEVAERVAIEEFSIPGAI
jgi:hypothetical protein